MSNVIQFLREFVSIKCGMVRTRLENSDGVGPWSDPRFEYRVEWNENRWRRIDCLDRTYP